MLFCLSIDPKRQLHNRRCSVFVLRGTGGQQWDIIRAPSQILFRYTPGRHMFKTYVSMDSETVSSWIRLSISGKCEDEISWHMTSTRLIITNIRELLMSLYWLNKHFLSSLLRWFPLSRTHIFRMSCTLFWQIMGWKSGHNNTRTFILDSRVLKEPEGTGMNWTSSLSRYGQDIQF